MKGCLWIVLGFLVIILITFYAFKYTLRDPDWCNESLSLGDCQMYPVNKRCYCVDTTNTGQDHIDLYTNSQNKCQNGSGQLATPDDPELLVWLSKRLYFMVRDRFCEHFENVLSKGVDRALVGLRKIDSQWYWMKKEHEERAEEIFWRPDVPPKTNDSHSLITVETIKYEDDYSYLAYNYDHYKEKDTTYKWYGITTTDNKPNHLLRGTYYICEYAAKPETGQEETVVASIVEGQEVHLCACNDERIYLSELESTGTFTSPHYPSNYCSDHNCRWIITTNEDLVIIVQLFVFSLETDMDFLYIYDGETDDSPLLQSCTGINCDDQISSGPAMQLHFHTDHIITNIGFKLKVTATHRDPCYCPEQTSISFTNVGESVSVTSPNYPNAYCSDMSCKWLITAPNDLGIHLHWEKFDTEQEADFVHIHEGNHIENILIDICSGKFCASVTSSTNQIYLTFLSNSQNSTDTGFRVIATVVKNYCSMEALFAGISPTGRVSSTIPPRSDGNMPDGAVVTLNCLGKHKISGTVEDFTQSTTCFSPFWSNHLGICVPVCYLNYSIDFTSDDVHFCGFGDNLETVFVEKGHWIIVKRYNYINGNKLIGNQTYTCLGLDSWSVQPPTCHPIGIMLIGGYDYLFNEDDTDQSIEFFTPTDKGPRTELVDLELLVPRLGHSGVRLPSGDVLVIGANIEGTFTHAWNTVEMINKYANQTTTFAPKISFAKGGSSAIIGDTVYLCGGYYIDNKDNSQTHLKVCEVFQDSKWSSGHSMLVGRYSFGLVAIGHWLYAIGGGWVPKVGRDAFSAEKYSPAEKRWQYIAPMPNQRQVFSTGVLNGSIYVCGNTIVAEYQNQVVDESLALSCDRYLPYRNTWYVMKEKMNMVHAIITSQLIYFDGRMFGFGAKMNSSDKIQGRYVQSYDEVTGSWTYAGETIAFRAYSAAVITSYVGNIPSALWKHNFNEVTNSVGNYTLNVSSLGHGKVMDKETGQVPVFIKKFDKPVDDDCVCGHNMIDLEVLDESKTLASPGYPEQYCNYHQCLWTISTAKSEYNLTVGLIWLAFSTENQMDMLYIYDEFGLLQVCTGSSCANHKSRGNTLFVYFESDHVTTDVGFSAEVSAIDPDPCYCSESTQVILTSPDESFTLESPNYPKPYCLNHNCGWNLSVPIGHLVRVTWKRFSVGDGHTFNISTSKKLLNSCTGEKCENVQTSENRLYLEFKSNSHVSNDGVFSALITVALSYCKKMNAPIGSITYDREPRVDGNMPVGSVATLFCPEGFKITDTRQDTSSNTACLAPDWSGRPTCSQVCKVNSTFESYERIHICNYDSGIRSNLVTVGQEIVVDEYTSYAKLSSSVFSCSHLGWYPQTPTCHRMAILIRCDTKAFIPEMTYEPWKDQKNLVLYYPLEKTTRVLEMQLEIKSDELDDWMEDDFITITLDDGRVLVVGETVGCWMIDIQLGTVTNTSSQVRPRRYAAAARLAGQVYICGGTEIDYYDWLVSSTCEVWANGRWQLLDAEMLVKRTGLIMVASSDALYVIGGRDENYSPLVSVERSSLETRKWEFVSPLKISVFFAAAVQFDGMILLCGGLLAGQSYETNRCQKYVIAEDRWLVMASMNYKRQSFSLVAFAGGVYAVGGIYSTYNSFSYTPVVDVELYDIHQDHWSIEFELPIGKAYNAYDSALVVPVD